jgi:adenylate kinase family enzyme
MSSESNSVDVLIITGPPGSGKTTVARAVASRHPKAVHLESDCFFRFVTSGFVEPWSPDASSQNLTVMGVVVEATATYAKAGYFTVLDGIIISQQFLEKIAAQLQSEGLAVAFALMSASLSTCLERASGRPSHPLDDARAVELLWKRFDELDVATPHVFNADTADAEQLADQIVANLHTRLLVPAPGPPDSPPTERRP